MIEPHYRLISNHRCDGYDIIVADWAGSKPTRVITRSDVAVEHRQDAWPLIVAALTGDTALLPPVDPRNPSRTPDPAVYTAPITRIAVIRGESDSLAIKVICPHCARLHAHGLTDPAAEYVNGTYGHRVADCEHAAGYYIIDPHNMIGRAVDKMEVHCWTPAGRRNARRDRAFRLAATSTPLASGQARNPTILRATRAVCRRRLKTDPVSSSEI